jgi:hypothetical protein
MSEVPARGGPFAAHGSLNQKLSCRGLSWPVSARWRREGRDDAGIAEACPAAGRVALDQPDSSTLLPKRKRGANAGHAGADDAPSPPRITLLAKQ